MADDHLDQTEQVAERAAVNTLVRAAGEIVGKLASLVLFAAIGRTLGEEGLGVFVLALSVATIVLIPIDLGLDRSLLRDVAADRSRAGALLGNVVALKLLLAGPAIVLAVLVLQLVDYSAELRMSIYILLFASLLESLGRTAGHVFIAVERSLTVSAAIVIQRFLAATLGISALLAGFGVTAVAWAYTAGAAAGLLVSVIGLVSQVSLHGLRPSRATSGELVSASTFALQDVATLLLFRIDAVILSLLATTAAVGRYGAAYRIFESTWFVSVAVLSGFTAMFTYLGRNTEPTLRSVFERALKLSLAALVPCTVAFGLCAAAIIDAVFGPKLRDAVGPLQILAPAVLLLGVATLATTVLMYQHRARPVLVLSLVAVAVNVALNLSLIGEFGAVGSAIAMLVTEVLLAGVGLYVARGLLGGLSWRAVTLSPLAGGVAMAATIVALGAGVPAMAAGALVYGLVLVATERAVNPEDVRHVTAMLRRRLPA